MKKILLFIMCIITCALVACSDEKDAGEKAKESVANTSWFHYRGTDEYRIYCFISLIRFGSNSSKQPDLIS